VRVAAEATPAGPPWLVIALGVIALLTAVATTAGPVLVEKIKQRGGKDAGDAQTKPLPATDKALHLIEKSIEDLRQERDEAQDELRAEQKARAEDRQTMAAQAVTIATQAARIESLEQDNRRLIDRLGRPS